MLTKEQIESKTFKKGIFGFNKDEVNSYLRELAYEYAELQAKYDALESENEISKKSLVENSVKIYELEKQLEQAAPGAKKEQNAANNEANKIINEAKKKANEVLANAKAELAKLKGEMEELKSAGAGASTISTSAFDTTDLDEEDTSTASTIEADPITKLRMKSQTVETPQKLKMKPKEEPKPQAFAGKTAFKEEEEEEVEEIFVGEVEEGANRNQVLIGDGDEDADFEFL